MSQSIIILGALAALSAITAMFLVTGRGRTRGELADRITAEAGLDYKARLAVIDRDEAAGLLPADEAEEARIRAGREALRLARQDTRDQSSKGPSPIALVATALVTMLIGIGGYLTFGNPDLADQPFAKRADDLRNRDPATMTMEEQFVLLQQIARDRPTEAPPHYFIGQLLTAQGRHGEALRAYQSALARDRDYVPALLGMGNSMVVLAEGDVSADAARVFARAAELDPTQYQAVYMVGLSAWQAGQKDTAEAIWAAMRDHAGPDSPMQPMFDMWVSMARDEAVPPRLP